MSLMMTKMDMTVGSITLWLRGEKTKKSRRMLFGCPGAMQISLNEQGGDWQIATHFYFQPQVLHVGQHPPLTELVRHVADVAEHQGHQKLQPAAAAARCCQLKFG